jgi:hypothetical protein
MFQALQPQVPTANVLQGIQAPLTNSITDEFQELNDLQEKIISCIEDKLHSIIDKRVSQGDTTAKSSLDISNDFRNVIMLRLSKMRSNTSRLDQIMNHLQEIV